MSEPASTTGVSDLALTERMTIRFSGRQVQRAGRAARILSRRRGQLVDEGTLVRETAIEAIEVILANASPEELEFAMAAESDSN